MSRRAATKLDAPVIVLGSSRSGTSMLVRMLGEAPGLVCWFEPQTLWRIGTAYRNHDHARPEDAKPWVKRRIRREFLRYEQEHGGRRVVEKTPTNILNIPFLRNVLPEAKIVHIVRDGRAMLLSQMQEYEKHMPWQLSDPNTRAYLRRTLRMVPWWEWPAYSPRAARHLFRRYVRRQPAYWFGLRYPGWTKDRGRFTRPEMIAKQWVLAVETAQRDLESVPKEMYIDLRYEQLVSDPKTWFARIGERCGIDMPEDYLEMVRQKVFRRSIDRWENEIDADDLALATPIMEPTLRRLGYLDGGGEP